MENGKKIEKEIKTKKNTEQKVDDTVILVKNEKLAIKFFALLSAFFASGLTILMFIFSVIACVSVFNLSNTELVNNNIVVTLISKLNNYSIVEVKELITAMANSFTFALFEIIIPTIAFVGAMLLIIVLAKRIINLVDDVTYEKDLYNKKKLSSIQDIISILSIVLLATLVIFNKPSIILYLLIEVLLCIIYLLFKKCVMMRKK